MGWRRARRGRGNAVCDTVTDYRGRAGDVGAAQARGIMGFYTAVTQGPAIAPGEIRWGEQGAPLAAGGNRYAGDLGPLQQFATDYGGKIGNSQKIRPGFSPGLPTTSAVPGQAPGDMLALLIGTDHRTAQATSTRQLSPLASLL